MSILVLEVARQGSEFFPNDIASARSLFGDLIEKTGANRILAMRADSSKEMPAGIEELAVELGIESKCLQIDRLDPSSWTGDEDPDEIWSDHLKNKILGSKISPDDRICLMMNAGSNWSALQLYSLFEVLGGSLWVTESPDGGTQWTATELSRKIPDEGRGEDALAVLAKLGINNRDWHTASDMQGHFAGSPKPKGVDITLGSIPDFVEDRDSPDGKEYRLTTSGRYHSMLALARKDSMVKVKKGPRGLVIFVRSVKEAESVIEYLDEHNTDFDKYAFVVGRIAGADADKTKEISLDLHEKAREHLPNRVVSSAEDVCFSIPPTGGIHKASTDVMKILHNLRKGNRGIEWSLETANILGLLRPALYQYSHLAGMPCLFITREAKGTGVHENIMEGPMHWLNIPDEAQIGNIRKVLNDSGASKFVATAFLLHDSDPDLTMMISKSKDGDRNPFYDFNIERFETGNPLRFSDLPKLNSQYRSMKYKLIKAEGYKAVDLKRTVEEGKFEDSFVLTPVGIVAGALLVNPRK